MGEVVDLHLLLVAVDRPLGVRQRRLVDAGVADEPIERFARLEHVKLLNKGTHGGEVVELDLHRSERLRVEFLHLRHQLHLVQVTHRTDHVVPAIKEIK